MNVFIETIVSNLYTLEDYQNLAIAFPLLSDPAFQTRFLNIETKRVEEEDEIEVYYPGFDDFLPTDVGNGIFTTRRTVLFMGECIYTVSIAEETNKIIEEGAYNREGKTGLWRDWLRTGELSSGGFYVNGKLEGLWVEKHRNGNKFWEATYHSGEEIGQTIFWNKNGENVKSFIDALLS